MSQRLYGFVEVRRGGRWNLVPEVNVRGVEGGTRLRHLLVDLFHHGAVMDEAVLQLDTSGDELSDNWVPAAHLAEALRDHPQLRPQDHPEAYQLDFATLLRFEWPRRLKWLHGFLPSDLPKGAEDFLVKDAAGVERVAAGDARVADDVTRELAAREFPILTDFPTASRSLLEYESGSGRRDDKAHHYLLYRSYQELLRGSGFLEELLPAMARLVPTADDQRPQNVRMVFWFE